MLEFLKKNSRKTAVFLIACLFTLQFTDKIGEVVRGEQTCVCAYDGYGYYMYITRLFQHGDLKLEQKEIQEIQDKYCGGIYAYQLRAMDNGNQVNIYHMGQAYLELPAYAVGDLFARMLHYPRDGFSTPYHLAFLLNALLFILLGIHFLSKLLRLFFSEQLCALILLIVYFGTNFWVTAVHSYHLQHIYLFALVAILFHALVKFRENPARRGNLILAALILGLISSIRPTHVLLGCLPLFLLRGVFPRKRAYWKALLLFPLAGLLFNIPQLLYWKLIGGSWFIPNLHVEEVIITDPHVFDFLFSYKKGWLLYTPVFLLLIPGFVFFYRQRKELFWGVFVSTILCIWIFASWECWWYAASYSSRAMVDLYPLLAVPLGFGLIYLGKRRVTAVPAMILIGCFIGLAAFQSRQFTLGYLHMERMTKAHYWYIFGKLSFDHYELERLEIDRNETEWPSKVRAEELGFGKLETIDFSKSGRVVVPGKKSGLLVKVPFFPKLKTDETLFDAQIIYRNADSLSPAEIHFEAISKYNTYNWKSFPLTTHKKAGSTDTLQVKFNLPVINHSGDQIQVYVTNPSDKEITIESLSIRATSLIRK
jgi:hypothetical protein